jgi:hypothetical protein
MIEGVTYRCSMMHRLGGSYSATRHSLTPPFSQRKVPHSPKPMTPVASARPGMIAIDLGSSMNGKATALGTGKSIDTVTAIVLRTGA